MTVKELCPILVMHQGQEIYFRTNNGVHLLTASFNGGDWVAKDSELSRREVSSIEWNKTTAYVIVK